MSDDRKKDLSPNTKNKRVFVLLGVLILMIIIIVIVAVQSKKVNKNLVNNPSANTSTAGNTASNNTQAQNSAATPTASNTPKTEGSSTPQAIALQTATAVVPGANLVSKNAQVLTSSGDLAKTDVTPDSALAPQQTLAISKNVLPSSVIKIEASQAKGFVPNSFTVKAGAPVTVSITNLDNNRSATLGFTDPSLSGVILGASPLETRAITFNAPTKAGDYKFIDGIPGHDASGDMIVK